MTTEEIVERGMYAPMYAGVVPDPCVHGEATNSGCGDRVKFDFKISDDGKIELARHTCKACVLTTAMADILCEALEGQTPDFVFTLDPFRMIGIHIGPNRLDCITVAFNAALEACKYVPVYLRGRTQLAKRELPDAG